MSKYSEIALRAVELVKNGNLDSPVDAWLDASFIYYPTSKSSREKGCPKSSFLGLCEEGRVVGIKSGAYTKSKLNKLYALKAISLLSSNGNLTEKELWAKISDKKYNQQMHVVLALYKAGHIQ
ncbi:conserved hypothetical protein [Oleispira antarctica RB-8]|uniref:Uncharacterized protein n=1 Tax=Oleispira antarctica RB-8 TaxID=698738 RepID=R4YTG0_OLEAN|nr:conserved hypothetical protein [Oleispira antarctica RB-8]